jgi:ATP-binding cassette subfamily B protein
MRREAVRRRLADGWAVCRRALRRRRVPVMIQLSMVECGAACLAMVMSYHGRRSTVSEVRDRCGGVRGGISAGAIVRAARSYGLQARGLRPLDGLITTVRLPAIVHWNEDHFVVVEHVRSRWVRIVDPAWGRRRLTRAEFDEALTEAILEFHPEAGFGRTSEPRPSALRMLAGSIIRLRGVRSLIAQVLLTSLLLQALGLALPLATKLIIDRIVGDDRGSFLWLVGVGLGIVVVAQVVSAYLRSVLLIYLQGRLDWQMLNGFAGHLFRLPLRYFQQRTTGDIVMRLSSIATLRDVLANQSTSTTLDAGLVLGYLILSAFFDPVLTGVILTVIVVQLVVLALTSGRIRDLMARTVAAQVNLNEYMVQTLHGVATVKASGAEPQVVAGMSERIFRWTSVTLRRSQLTAQIDTFVMALRVLTPLLILWLGTMRVFNGQITMGTLFAIVGLSAAMLVPLSAVVNNGRRFQLVGVQLERLGEILGAEPEQGGTASPPPKRAGGARLELREVSFRYAPEADPVVKDVSAVIESGRRTAIVGRSGAGKTTLVHLLLGLYRPTAGEIRYDGVPITEIEPSALRRDFGVVLQQPFALRATIGENIAFAHPDASFDDVVRAARLAGVHDEVASLPLGYNTRLAEGGVGLSGGQLQRLALARALVASPSVLILDEATSHLDSATEQTIVANLNEISCTQVVIAHRLSTIQDADLILVMRDGEIVEAGTHDGLLAACGDYADLVAAQLAGETTAPPPPILGDCNGRPGVDPATVLPPVRSD